MLLCSYVFFFFMLNRLPLNVSYRSKVDFHVPFHLRSGLDSFKASVQTEIHPICIQKMSLKAVRTSMTLSQQCHPKPLPPTDHPTPAGFGFTGCFTCNLLFFLSDHTENSETVEAQSLLSSE